MTNYRRSLASASSMSFGSARGLALVSAQACVSLFAFLNAERSGSKLLGFVPLLLDRSWCVMITLPKVAELFSAEGALLLRFSWLIPQ